MLRLICLLLVAVAGCTPRIDLAYVTGTSELRELNPGEYEFRTMANVSYPDNNQRAEAQRLMVLNELLAKNNYCTRGYEVTNRRTMVKIATFGVKDVYYRIRCK
jgi:hypothetical protein